MKLKINSKTYGEKIVLVDDEDYERMLKDFGNTTWCLSKSRNNTLYVQKRVNKKIIFLHRYIMNCPKGMYVDHINHNTLDNRKENLRITTNANNLRNGNIRKNNTSGVNGVYYDKKRKKYVAGIKVDYKKVHLGYFKKLEDAIKIRKEAEKLYWEV